MKKLDLVNAKIGSLNEERFSNGNIYPITAVPFGMTNFCIQTTHNEKNWFFNASAHTFEGVRLTHQPSPWVGDYGHLLILPFSGEIHPSLESRWSSYRPEEAGIRPYELSVNVQRYRVNFNLAPTCRGAMMQVKNKTERDTGIALQSYCDDTEFNINGNVVTGYTDAMAGAWQFGKIREYFYIEFSSPIKSKTALEKGGVAVFFDGDVEMKMATGFVSAEQTKINFDRELSGKTYSDVRDAAEKAWEENLSLIEVEGAEDKMRTFYSCMYRAFLYPRVFYELDKNGNAVHFNADTQKTERGVFYTDNGFWDTYRTVYPFLSIVKPDLVREMLEGFINYSEEVGWLPNWLSPGEFSLMPGTLIEAVLSDAAVNGIITGELLQRAYKAMLHNAYAVSDKPRRGRTALKEYMEKGYISDMQAACVNHTCDCAYGDYCIAQVAKITGDTEQYEKLTARSKNYANIFDSETGFLRARDKNGDISKNFDPYDWGGPYCEGSGWQSSFAVYHDIDGLAELYGGKEKLEKKLDELFNAEPIYNVGGYGGEIHEMSEMACVDFGQMAISNQPSFHIPWLYTMIGKREKTIAHVKNLAENAFSFKNDGFPGDEDNGTMACWYIFACLGFYPVCPGSGEFICSEPLFDKIEVCGKRIGRFNGDRVTYAEVVDKMR